jgi:hypothetical protein
MKTLVFILAMLITGCGSKFTGSYSGVMKYSLSSAPALVDKEMRVSLEENSKEGTVTGSITLGDGSSGTLAGKIDPTHDNWVVGMTITDSTTNACPGTYTGVMKLDPDDSEKLSGNYEGSATCGSVNITFNLNRQ